MDIELDADPEFLPAIAQGFHITAAMLLLELAKTRGSGAWFDALHARLRYDAATIDIPMDAPPAVAARWIEASVAAVDHIFDSVEFEGKANR